MNKQYYIYIITNKYNTVYYTGVTNNLRRRIYEHKNGSIEGFSKQYRCNKLVWFEETENIESAIIKEKQIKKWKREYKENAIMNINPEWKDLYEEL